MVWAYVRFNKSPHDGKYVDFVNSVGRKRARENESDIPVRELLSDNLIF